MNRRGFLKGIGALFLTPLAKYIPNRKFIVPVVSLTLGKTMIGADDDIITGELVKISSTHRGGMIVTRYSNDK